MALGVVEVDQGVVSGLVGEEEGSWDQMIGRSHSFYDQKAVPVRLTFRVHFPE